jgi:hypothetical protein
MKDTNFIEILPFDEVEIIDVEPSPLNPIYRVVGLSKSLELVTLALVDKEGHVIGTTQRRPHMVHVRLLACDPRTGAKYPSSNGAEETKHYLSVFQAFVRKRTGDFDEWQASEETS